MKATPPQKKQKKLTVNLGQLTQMWVGGFGWSQSFINHVFMAYLSSFLAEISSKFSANVPNLMKSGLGQLSLIYRFL